MNLSLRATLFASLSALAFAGCNVEDDAPAVEDDHADVSQGEVLGEAEQPFTASGSWDLVVTEGNASHHLGAWSGTVAFLRGVGGNFANGGQAVVYKPTSLAQAWVWAAAGEDATVRSWGAIVAPATATSEVLWSNNSYASTNPKKLLGPKAGRRCMITQITNYVGNNYFTSTSDVVKIVDGGDGNWYIHGSGRAAGGARCATISSFIAGTGGGADTYPMGGNDPGKYCWFERIGGNFRTNSGSNGVFINNDSSGWSLTVSAGKVASAACGT